MKLFTNEKHGVTRAGKLFEFEVGEPTEVEPKGYAEALLRSYPNKYSKEPFPVDDDMEQNVADALNEITETVDDAPPFTEEELDKLADESLLGMYAEKYGQDAPGNISRPTLIKRIME